MPPREQLDRKLADLRSSVISLGRAVDEQMRLALKALEMLDSSLGEQVITSDLQINAARYAIEDACSKLIVTEQPAARDLRMIIAALNIIVDLERIGDKAKAVVEVIPAVAKSPNWSQQKELKQMGTLVNVMLYESIQAYADGDIEAAKQVANRYQEIHPLYESVLHRTIEHMTEVKKEKKVTAAYGVLQVAQDLDRVGDLVTNVAERIIYVATGNVAEMNLPPENA
jgi:phosphate transport system protein